MRIIFVRHGHPDYGNDCLTPLGQKHAAAAAERLKEEGIEQIFSSTCGRALETAGYTARQLGLEIEPCDFMREIDWGATQGEPLFANGHPWDTANNMAAENQSLLCADWMEREPFCRNKVRDHAIRISKAADEWLESLGYTREGLYYRVTKEDTNRTIAVFGHAGASGIILSELFNLPLPFLCAVMEPDFTGITVVTLSDEIGSLVTPRFEIVSDARHIKGLEAERIISN